ncbi:MAG: hypothetical protein K2Y42_06780 [Hyphomicrobium sp.]|uniref:hypothetical protein n=1 Tax=Hyphomicrobium sp. TaxID=82 RepID=UPI0025BF4882|nr:hypothetical protein [Hyphomicrobium sp.]MBX9862442.1 hypothetical protein [Hyphomicrobium sp.]
MTTIRNVLQFPRMIREMSEKLEPLDAELAVIREMNWQLDKLPNDAAVVRAVRYVMEHRGFTINDMKDPSDGDNEV